MPSIDLSTPALTCTSAENNRVCSIADSGGSCGLIIHIARDPSGSGQYQQSKLA